MNTLILHNGPIYTLDPQQPVVRALAIRNGQVFALGSEGKVQAAAATQHAETINLHGRAVVPGLTDAHVHLTLHGLAARTVRLNEARSLDQALALIVKRVATLPADAWLEGGGWNHADWGGTWPTRDDLDRVCPNHPAILLRRDGHSAWVNSKALERAGITDTTADPPGGWIQRDQAGRATGILQEQASALVANLLKPPTPAERQSALTDALKEALSYGLTSLHIPATMEPTDGRATCSDLQVLRERGELPARCLFYLSSSDLDAAIALGLRSGFGDHWIRFGGVKLFADGALGSETAEMFAPYAGSTSMGLATIDFDELNSMFERANRAGIALAVHAIGDAANRKVLDAIELADAYTHLPLRNRIEHAQILHADDISRFAKLNVVASMQPIHATSDMATADRLLGERCATAYAWRSLLKAGALLAFGSDAPVESLNPWLGIHAAVTRQRPTGEPQGGWYASQRLTLEEALHGFIVGPASASGEAAFKGTLAPGMVADLAVLTQDPFHMPIEQLHSVTVALTLVAGQVVYRGKE